MNRIILFLLIVIFSIFLGSQITEGFLLVPYWKTLSKVEFYKYYNKFGPVIGNFYTLLTIIAVLTPVSFSIYCYLKKHQAFKLSIISTFFAFLIIVIFYCYFKGANQQFYASALDTNELKSELNKWEYYHWLRVLIEAISLFFLILSINLFNQKNT